MLWLGLAIGLVVGACVGCVLSAVLSAGACDDARRHGYLAGRIDERGGLPMPEDDRG